MTTKSTTFSKVYRTPKNSKRNVPNQIAKKEAQIHQKNENKNHIPDLELAFPFVDNDGLFLVFTAS